MAALDSESNSISFSMSEPSLRESAPPCLRRAGPLREKFIAANDHDEKQQKNILNDNGRTRDEERNGSQMVKSEKPFPELKPTNSHDLKKYFFDQAWLREQRQAQLNNFRIQRQSAPQQNRQPEPVFER